MKSLEFERKDDFPNSIIYEKNGWKSLYKSQKSTFKIVSLISPFIWLLFLFYTYYYVPDINITYVVIILMISQLVFAMLVYKPLMENAKNKIVRTYDGFSIEYISQKIEKSLADRNIPFEKRLDFKDQKFPRYNYPIYYILSNEGVEIGLYSVEKSSVLVTLIYSDLSKPIIIENIRDNIEQNMIAQ